MVEARQEQDKAEHGEQHPPEAELGLQDQLERG